MPRRSSFAAASALLAATAAAGAEIAARTVQVEVLADGSYRTRTHLELRLETSGDADAWSRIAIPLDENLTLESLGGTVAMPDGSTRTLRQAEIDSVGDVGGDIVASTSSNRVVSLAGVPAGSLVTLDFATLTRPYFPAGEVGELRSAVARTARLAVSVRSAIPGFRFRISGDATGLAAEASEKGVTIAAANLPPLVIPSDGPDWTSAAPHLFFGWGADAGWQDVGRWWSELISGLRPPGERFAAAVRELAPGGRPPGEAVAAVLAYVHTHVRYVAVELGIGGWKPADPESTLEHGWGDCKALALLTAELLRRAGVSAVPAAAAVRRGAIVDPEFPTIGSFDHVVVAVPAAALGLDAILDEGGTRAFLDPTDTAPGSDRWPTHLMGQRVLLLDGNRSALVTVAASPGREARRLRVNLAVAPDGSAQGTLALELAGEPAAAWIVLAKAGRPADLEVAGRRLVAEFLPSATILGLGWGRENDAGAPVVVQARVVVPGFLTSGSGSAWFQVGGPVVTPPASALVSRAVPFVRRPQSAESVWSVRLPDGWRLEEFRPDAVSNRTAAFGETVSVAGAQAVVTRHAELKERCVDVTALPLLREVAAAEHRAQRRRLVVRMSSGSAAAPPR